MLVALTYCKSDTNAMAKTARSISQNISGSRRFPRLIATAATGLLAMGLVAGGAEILSSRAASVQIEQAAPPVTVSRREIRLESGFNIPHSFIGRVEAVQTTSVAFEFGGTVSAVLVDEGSKVGKGQVLARLDTRQLENQKTTRLAARRALEAQIRLSQLTLDRQQALQKKGFATTQAFDQVRLGLAELEARIAEADAAIAGIDIQLDKSVLYAPFDGQIGNRSVDEGAFVNGGLPVVTLLQQADPQMRVGLAPSVANTLAPGQSVDVEIAGRTYAATLLKFRPDLDPATRTRTALFAIPADEGEATLLYGQTGRVKLESRIEERGAWVPVASLREGARGLWTVLTLGEINQSGETTVEIEAVEVLYADEERAFVRGTFRPGTEMIDAGPHRVTPGQSVRVLERS